MTERVIVVGGGAAGLSTANGVANAAPRTEVILIDRQEFHYYQPGFTSVMFGDATLDDIRKPIWSLLSPGVVFVDGEVEEISPDEHTLRGTFGERGFDYLVVATGVGLAESDRARCAPWSPDGAVACRDRVRGLTPGDTVLVTVAGLPYRCPPAPFDLAVRLRRSTGAEVTVAHPWPRPLAPFGPGPTAMMERVLSESGVPYVSGDGGPTNPDLTIEVPEHRPSGLIEGAGLAGDSGWMEVDLPSFRHPRHNNVFGVGDVVAPPLNLGMAGTLGVFEGDHVAAQIVAELDGRPSPERPRLEAICFMHFGDTGSFMHCDFSPLKEGHPPSCAVMPELPYFVKARALFAQEWFDSLIRGAIH